jgi:hypothetical protein
MAQRDASGRFLVRRERREESDGGCVRRTRGIRTRTRRRGRDRSAGTKPADEIHGAVVETMAEVDIDSSDRSPKWMVVEELEHSHFVITMGCTINEFVRPMALTTGDRPN